MRTLIIFFLLSTSFNLFAAEKVLFIDANNNPGEIKVAREVAKQQGKELIVYPTTKKDMTVDDVVNLIQKNNFESITFSGHSGGMLFYGDHGEIHLKDLIEKVKSHPNAQHIKSLYLLGCNSGNKSKMMFWKDAFPSLKFIAGFDGTAPLGTNQNGLNYYRDIMLKEGRILQSANENEIKQNLESVRNIKTFPTSTLVECQPNLDFIYQPQTRLGSSFEKFSMAADCEETISYFKMKYKDEITAFISREKNPRTAPAARLREIYEALRQKEHCEKDAKGPAEANQFLFMRFMSEFDKNYFNYFNKSFTSLISDLKKFSENAEQNLEKQIAEKESFYHKLKDDSNFASHLLQENKNNIKKMLASMPTNDDTKKCIDTILGESKGQSTIATACSSSNLSDQAIMIKAKILHGIIDKSDDQLIEHLQTTAKKDLDSAKKLKNSSSLKEEINTTINQLESFMSNTSSFKQADMDKMVKKLYPIASLVGTKKAQTATDAILAYRNIDAYTMPYSWYDKPYGQGIEPVTDPLLGKNGAEYVDKLDNQMMLLRDEDGTFKRIYLLNNRFSRL